ncbi:hypothetical protein [Dactylosporangium sp. NPDC049140]|jgi:hypothetical protein|uniref:hypothetical protein n=1 Tax=Dactylosporangium sp. NPDC049140 TaxID=3155647 RepID=UPI00340B0688
MSAVRSPVPAPCTWAAADLLAVRRRARGHVAAYELLFRDGPHALEALGEVLRDVRSYQRGAPRLEADGELHAELLAALSWTNASLAEPEPAAL